MTTTALEKAKTVLTYISGTCKGIALTVRIAAGFLLAPLDALVVTTISGLRKYFPSLDKKLSASYEGNEGNERRQLAWLAKGLTKWTRYLSRGVPLAFFAIGFIIALAIPIPGSVPAYLTSVGGICLFPLVFGYTCSYAGRFVGAIVGNLIDRCKADKQYEAVKGGNKAIVGSKLFTGTQVILTALVGDKSAMHLRNIKRIKFFKTTNFYSDGSVRTNEDTVYGSSATFSFLCTSQIEPYNSKIKPGEKIDDVVRKPRDNEGCVSPDNEGFVSADNETHERRRRSVS